MNQYKKQGIINKHFLTSVVIFVLTIFLVSTFISFLKDMKKNDISFKKANIDKIKTNVK